jgi:hypothetical protein
MDGISMMGGMTWNNAQSGVSVAQRVDNFLSGVSVGRDKDVVQTWNPFPTYPSTDPTRGVRIADPVNFGDSVVNGAQDVREAFRNTITHVKEILDGGMEGMGVAQFMQVQVELMQLNITLEISAKIPDKVSQGGQTLFRNQG